MRLHPPERAPEEFKRIREAYETLGNVESRSEYDDRMEPQAIEWFSQALLAMKQDDHDTAARLLKQVLLLEPKRGFVRNLLGLCFVYRGEPSKAMEQYSRLLIEDGAAAAWFGNAAVAARQSKQFDRAISLFTQAIERSDDDGASYYAGVADVHVDMENYALAREWLEAAIHADGKVDFEDLRFFTKLLELCILQRDSDAVQRELKRITVIAKDEEQRRYLAWKLGVLAIQLVEVRAFEFAEPIADLAQRLQPEDEDYVALSSVARMLRSKDYSAVISLLCAHPSFSDDGWLAHVRPTLDEWCGQARILSELIPITSAPSLFSVNGCGMQLYGEFDADTPTASHVSICWLTVFSVPVFPLARYRVVTVNAKTTRFLGKLPISRFLVIWRTVVVILLLALLFSNGGAGRASASAVGGGDATTQAAELTAPPLGENGQSGETAANSTDAFTRSAEKSWIEAERDAIGALERIIAAIDDEMARSERELTQLKSQIDAAESGVGTYKAGDPWYDDALERHNREVRQYNVRLGERQALYRTYSSRLAGMNQRIDEYNQRP